MSTRREIYLENGMPIRLIPGNIVQFAMGYEVCFSDAHVHPPSNSLTRTHVH